MGKSFQMDTVNIHFVDKIEAISYAFTILVHLIAKSTLSTPAEEFRRGQVFTSYDAN